MGVRVLIFMAILAVTLFMKSVNASAVDVPMMYNLDAGVQLNNSKIFMPLGPYYGEMGGNDSQVISLAQYNRMYEMPQDITVQNSARGVAVPVVLFFFVLVAAIYNNI